jgi:penicillin-binding protein 1C
VRTGALILSALAGGLLVWALVTSQSALKHHSPSHLMLDRHGEQLGEVPAGDGQLGYWPLPEELPEKVVVATLETEDRTFFEHGGVAWSSVARAVLQNVRHVKVLSGASTIPMQVARMQRPASRTPLAKLREAVEGTELISEHGHDAVLRQYLQIAPYGNRAHGVVRAARLYFDKPVEDVSWLQAAFLAALPQQPGRMNPYEQAGRTRALKRARRILESLHDRGIITDDDLRIALSSDLGLVKPKTRPPEAMHAVLEWARHLKKDAPLITHTTIDLGIQRQAARAVKHGVQGLQYAGASNGAALVVDLPTGDILAWVGSKDYFDADDKGAVDFLRARRSPGSTLKPFIYGLALERGNYTPATLLPDTPWELPQENGASYIPENITHNFFGPMLLREALGNSRNIPALRVLADIGVDRAVELFIKGGVQNVSRAPDAYGLPLAVGALNVTPVELAVLYTAVANRGVTLPLRHFQSETQPPFTLSGAAGGVEGSAPQPGTRLFREDVAMALAHILSDREARRPGFPAGGPLDFDYAVAAKTGTSQGYRDAWSVFFSDRLLVVTWVGNHDWRRMNKLTGGAASAPISKRIMDDAMLVRAPHKAWASNFPDPTGWTPVEVCPLSGKLPGPGCTHRKTELFPPGQAPTEECPFHVEVALDTRNGLRATPMCPAKFVVKKQMLALTEEYESWARRQRLDIAPTRVSPLCDAEEKPARVAISEPLPKSRFLFDPDTPAEFSTVRLAARVTPASEEIVWLVDGTPVGQVGWPHELRVTLTPGKHVIRAALARAPVESAPVAVTVDD